MSNPQGLRGLGEGPTPAPAGAVLIADAIKGLINFLGKSVGGFITGHLKEVNGLVPEVVRVNMITFHARIEAGPVITQAASVRISSDYNFELTGITASFSAPVGAITEYADFARFAMQLRESGRNYDIFDAGPVNLLPIVSTAGPGSMMEFPRGMYLFRAGSEIQCTISADSIGGTYSGVTKSVVVLLKGNYVRKGG